MLFRQGAALLGGHDDVAIVGQDKHGFSRNLIHASQDTLCRGIHGLAAGYHLISAQVFEHGGKAFAGAYGQKAVFFFGSSYRVGGCFQGFGMLQLLLYGVQVIGALGGSAGCQVLGLGTHVLDLGQLQGAIFLSLHQCRAGNIRVHMDFKGLVILTDHQTIANAVQIGAERL